MLRKVFYLVLLAVVFVVGYLRGFNAGFQTRKRVEQSGMLQKDDVFRRRFQDTEE